MADATNPFEAFDETCAATPTAERGSFIVAPAGVYKFVLAAVNIGKTEEQIVDHEVIDNRKNGGAAGVKVFAEIVLPVEVKNETSGEMDRTKGKVIDHVFWVTEKSLTYVKRDYLTITGKPLEKTSELMRTAWAGRTFEGVVENKPDKSGVTRTRIAWINPWDPKTAAAGTAAAAPPVGTAPPPASKGTAAAPPKAAAPAVGAPAAGGGLTF